MWIEPRDSTQPNIRVGPRKLADVPEEEAIFSLDTSTHLQLFLPDMTGEAQARAAVVQSIQVPNGPPVSLAIRAQKFAGTYDTRLVLQKPFGFLRCLLCMMLRPR